MNWINKIIDNFYFKRMIEMEDVGLGEKDKEWLKSHSAHLKRVAGTMKAYILNQTFNTLTIREHQRRKDWFDCLTTIQRLCETSTSKDRMNWLTMKPKKSDKK